MNKYILVMKPAGEDYASLDDAVTTVCDSPEDVIATILGFLSGEEDTVDGNMDFEEAQEIIEDQINSLSEDEPQCAFLLGENEDDDYPGMEILIKLI